MKENKIKILAVGNSFSQDATAWLEILTDKLYVRNLYIGGCSLEEHVTFLKENRKEYNYEYNGSKIIAEKVSLEQALAMEQWDYITVQQASRLSGKKETYYPYITELIDFIKANSKAEILFHQTWAYEKNYENEQFEGYDNNQQKMWQEIKKTTMEVCEKENLRMIKSGEFITKLREFDYFDVENGGISITREGSHLDLNYGRIGVASLWAKFFTGEIPKYIYREDLPEGYKCIRKVLEEMQI